MKNFCLLFFAYVLFASCKKDKKEVPQQESSTTLGTPVTSLETPGLPLAPVKVCGYFYESYRRFAGESSGYLYAFAALSSTPRNLTRNYDHYNETNSVDTTGGTKDLPNVDGGTAKLNGFPLGFLWNYLSSYILSNPGAGSDFKNGSHWDAGRKRRSSTYGFQRCTRLSESTGG